MPAKKLIDDLAKDPQIMIEPGKLMVGRGNPDELAIAFS